MSVLHVLSTEGNVSDLNGSQQPLKFRTVEEYLRAMHPEYNFVFELKQHSRERWNYSPKSAEQTQLHMIENACEVALRSHREEGLEIIISGG